MERIKSKFAITKNKHFISLAFGLSYLKNPITFDKALLIYVDLLVYRLKFEIVLESKLDYVFEDDEESEVDNEKK